MMRKLMVTGSRDWVDRQVIWDALVQAASVGYDTLVVGDCPTGADMMAKEIWEGLGLTVDRKIAHWDLYGKAAGPLRNQELVDADPQICMAFLHPESRGTRDAIARARDAKIPVFSWMEG